jgi:hypothetical protein
LISSARGQVLLDDLGAGDVARHQVGRELHPVERELQRLGDGLDHQRLGEARHADQEGMPARQNGGEDPVHRILLADDPAGHLRPEGGYGALEALELADVVVRGGFHYGHECLWTESRNGTPNRANKLRDKG